MAHEVIMPALGMAQETGLIVAWIKAPGDAVKAGEPLMEVETDKATMEVEAQADGYLTDVRYEAGQDVPVGKVIALISDSAAGSGTQPVAAPVADAAEPKPAEKPVAQVPDAAPPPAAAPAAEKLAAPAPSVRLLASPKARRLAAEQGLDLARLVEAGYRQPFHAADVEVLRNFSSARQTAATATATMAQITASVPRTPSEDFLAWAVTEGVTLARGRLFAAFAAAALRFATAESGTLIVALLPPGGPPQRIVDPDLGPLSAKREAEEVGAVALTLRDLTGSVITGMRGGAKADPLLTVAAEGDRLILTLDFAETQMDEGAAITLITEFAARLADPRRHLL
ncbi:MAG: biotin/lipoyl-containing protein [Gemmobacter sp.]